MPDPNFDNTIKVTNRPKFGNVLKTSNILKLNNKNIDKSKTEITIVSSLFNTIDITEYVNSINYSQDQQIEYLYENSDVPTHVGYGGTRASGNMIISDAGVMFLNKEARKIGSGSFLDLGKIIGLDIIISYFDYREDNSISDDILYGVRFINYTRGVTGAVNFRNLKFIIAKIYEDTNSNN